MNDQEFAGFQCRPKNIALALRWLAEAWFVLLPALLVGLHWYSIQRLGLSTEELKTINKIVSAGLQIVGAGAILYSLDASLRLFTPASLWARIVDYGKRFPLIRWRPPPVRIIAIGIPSPLGMPSAVFHIPLKTTDERVAALEGQVRQLEATIAKQREALERSIKETTTTLEHQVKGVERATNDLADTIQRQTADNITLQLFGALLVIHSAVAGVFT